jgi:hypothetical protein
MRFNFYASLRRRWAQKLCKTVIIPAHTFYGLVEERGLTEPWPLRDDAGKTPATTEGTRRGAVEKLNSLGTGLRGAKEEKAETSNLEDRRSQLRKLREDALEAGDEGLAATSGSFSR